MKLRTAVLIAALVSLSLSACGPESHLKLTLRTESITVPRLVTPAIELVPAAPPSPSLPPIAPIATLLPKTPAPAKPVAACPTADALAQPAKPANVEVTAPPAAGPTTQSSAGNYSTASGDGSLAGTVTSVVKALPSTTASNGQRVDAWSVERTDAARKSRSVEVYQLVHPLPAGGGTNPGIYLVGLAWDDPTRGTLRFQASGNGLWILPTPVQVAANDAQYAGADTDPATLTTLSLTRNVRGRKRVDACGQLIDTWSVQMTGTLTTATAQWQVTWTQQLATGYGAADVEDTLSLSSVVSGASWTRTLRNTALPKEVAA